MNLDDLISKYLDGELSPADDQLLRQMIGESKESKEDFDTAVVLNSACREDAASVVPPASLIEETESKILMRILSEQSIVNEGPAPAWLWRKRTSMALVSVFVLLFGFLRISDFYLQNYKPMMLSIFEEEKARLELQTINYTKSTRLVKSEGAIATARPKIVSERASIASNASGKASFATQAIATSVAGNSYGPAMMQKPVEADFQMKTEQEQRNAAEIVSEMNMYPVAVQTETVTNRDNEIKNAVSNSLNSDNLTLARSSVPADNMFKPANNTYSQLQGNGNIYNTAKSPLSIMQLSALDYYPVKTDVQLSTFLATDVARMGLNVDNKTLVSHVSQGIAYPLGKSDVIGVELGYSSFNYNDKMIVSRAIASSIGSTDMVEVTNPGDEESTIINVIVPYKRTKQLVWGSAFYERNLLSYGAFSLNGRLGAGASSDGLISFGRIYGRYQIIPGLSFSIGADGRLFRARIISKESTTDSWRATTSLVYGLQFSF